MRHLSSVNATLALPVKKYSLQRDSSDTEGRGGGVRVLGARQMIETARDPPA